MLDNFEATSLDNTKGQDEFSAVEDLIKETLAETRLEQQKTPPPSPVKPAAQPQPQTAPAAQPQTTTVAQKYEATFKEYMPGDIVKGKVLKLDQGSILVDINYKADGLVASDELSGPVNVGDVINVMIETLENKEGYVVLSQKMADQEQCWDLAYNAYKKKEVLEGKVTQVLKGGLAVDCDGIRGFVPASQVDKKAGESLEQFQDKIIPLKVIELNRRQGKIVLSHKQAAGSKSRVDIEKIFNGIETGQIRKGTVSSLKTFGAFVNLGGIEGLIHLSELAWKRVKHPSDVLKVGQELDVFVLGVDKTNKKVSLGLKELLPDPWENATEHFKPGQVVKAKVVRFAKFGAFAELDHDLEGLIHNTELALDPVFNPADAVEIGKTYDAKVLRVLPEEQKIGLSIKAVLKSQEKAEPKQVEAKQEAEAKVTIGDMIAHKEQVQAEKEEVDEVSATTE
ncbi:MAG: S1 RNA-binding domain-containing protein [bacterium]